MNDLTWLEAVKQRYEKAMDMVCALCLPKGAPGARQWLMSIPARPDYDPDLVISASLKDIRVLCLAAEELIGALESALSMLAVNTSEDLYRDEAAVLNKWKRHFGGDKHAVGH